jgi:hypothetical protein
VPFLLDMFRIPADTFQLYLATGVVSARFGTLLSAIHMLAIAIVGSCAAAGALRLDARKLLRFAVTTAILGAVVIGGMRLMVGRLAGQSYDKDKILTGMEMLRDRGEGRRLQGYGAAARRSCRIGARSRARARLAARRVFHRQPALRLRNDAGDLVGFDVEMALQLAATSASGSSSSPRIATRSTPGSTRRRAIS